MAESRVVADLLLKGVSNEEWQQAITLENVLQCSTTATAERLGRLLRQRLQLVSEDLLKIITDGTSLEATHACLAAAVKRHHLLSEFLTSVLHREYRVFAKTLNISVWEDFLAECASRDPKVLNWTESTRRKLRNVTLQILEQAGYIDSSRSLQLQRIHIADSVRVSLVQSGDTPVYNCINIKS